MNKAEIDVCLNCTRATCSGNCLRMMTLKRREARQLYLNGERVTQRDLARLCHVGHARITACVKQGMTGDQIIEHYGGKL